MRLIARIVFALVYGWGAAAVRAENTPWAPPEGFSRESASIAAPRSATEVPLERVWIRRVNPLIERIVVSQVRRPIGLARYLALWRESHGCAVKPLQRIRPLSWADKRQTSLTGSCESGEVFVMHILQVGDVFYEFHVTQPTGPAPLVGEDAFRAALNHLLGEVGPVQDTPGAPKASGIARAQARQRIQALAMVRAFGDNLRLRALADGAEIGPKTCTGSRGECLYWFRAETRKEGQWVFWRLFGVSPYDGTLFLSTNSDLSRAYGGQFRPLGPSRAASRSGPGRSRNGTPSTVPDFDDFIR